MKAIWRQSIEITDAQSITAPGLGSVLAVDNSWAFGPEVWFTVDTDQPPLSVTLWVIGTGNPVPAECLLHGDYVGHFYAAQGAFVGHLYASTIHEEGAR